jgi:uncharacterized RDD family membrane protein YckC
VTEKLNHTDNLINSAKSQGTLSVLAKIKAKAKNLSPEETREILTPFAFKIDQSLLGIPLAVPWRRGIALLIDLLFIAILSDTPGELLAILVAITLFRLGSKKRAVKFGNKPGLRKMGLRVIGAFIVFVVLADTLPSIFSTVDEFSQNVEQAGQSQPLQSHEDSDKQNEDAAGDIVSAGLNLASTFAISQSDCTDYSCWQQLVTDLFSAYLQQTPTAAESALFMDNLLKNVSDNGTLSTAENTQLATVLQQIARAAQVKVSENTRQNIESDQPDVSMVQGKLETLSAVKEHSDNGAAPVYKGFAWLQGLIEDLGIGFGWAAFYFTMFTAIWHGQTPGKKLLRIRVLQLDGTPLSVWDSFGRYGGYGAGIATGLLGFAQIYWDPNRQAIHDKISATIVINDTEVAREQMAHRAKPSNENENNVDGAASQSTES